MAHNTSSLPWETLTSRWEPSFVRLSNTQYHRRPSTIEIRLGTQPDFWASRESRLPDLPSLSGFATTFRDCAVAEARQLRQRLSRFAKPANNLNDIIISAPVARRITPHLLKYRTSLEEESSCALPKPHPRPDASIPLCTHQTGLACGCILPLPYRRWAAFCVPLETNHDSQGTIDILPTDAFFSQVVLAILLSQDEIQPILRLVASSNDVVDAKSAVSQSSGSIGCYRAYRSVLREAMRPYILLNAFYQLRETWHPDAKREAWHDYRDTDLYQTLMCLVKGGLAPVSGSHASLGPHQSFFEMPEAWSLMPFTIKKPTLAPIRIRSGTWDTRLPMGTMPFSSFAGRNAARRAEMKLVDSQFHSQSTARFLQDKGLPMEIVDMIIPLAERDTWHFAVSDDPLNIRNRPSLLRYLQRCWDIILLCTLFLEKQGHDVLEAEVYAVLNCVATKYQEEELESDSDS